MVNSINLISNILMRLSRCIILFPFQVWVWHLYTYIYLFFFGRKYFIFFYCTVILSTAYEPGNIILRVDSKRDGTIKMHSRCAIGAVIRPSKLHQQTCLCVCVLCVVTGFYLHFTDPNKLFDFMWFDTPVWMQLWSMENLFFFLFKFE